MNEFGCLMLSNIVTVMCTATSYEFWGLQVVITCELYCSIELTSIYAIASLIDVSIK